MNPPETLKCRACGKEMAADAKVCPNCCLTTPLGRATPAISITPVVAGFCIAMGVLSLLLGCLLVVFGVSDSGHNVGAGVAAQEVYAGVALVCSSLLWFVFAKGITLLAQIAHNTQK